MIKLNANVSKKVPIPEMEYSSQHFSAGMEVEVSSNTSKGELREKYQNLYLVLSECIEEQIEHANGGGGQVPQPQAQPAPQPQQNRQGRQTVRSRSGGNGRGGNGKQATEAQARAVFAIARSKGYELNDVLSPYGVNSPYQLSIGDASSLIDSLKNGGN